MPSLLWELDQVLPEADFVSIGSNDLVMFLTAADRANQRVAKNYDPIALPRLRALRHIVDMARRYNVPITMCGELAGKTVEALALMSIGMTRLSMSPPSIGPIKEMVLGARTRARSATSVAAALLEGPTASGIRELLLDWVERQGLVDLESAMPQLPRRTSSTPSRSASTASRRRCPPARRPTSSSGSARNMPSSSRWCGRSWPTRSCVADLAAAEELLESGDTEMAEMAEAEIGELKPRLEQMEQRDPHPAAAQGRGGRKERHPRSARRHRRRRGGAVRGRSAPHVPALCRPPRLEVRR